MISLIEYEEKYKAIWQDIAGQNGNLYQDIRWKNIIEQVYKYKPNYLLIKKNSEIIGIIPAFIVNNTFFSLPYLSYSGFCILYTDNEIKNQIIQLLLQRYSKIAVRERTNISFNENDYVNSYSTFIKIIDKPSNDIFNELGKKQRNLIRKSYTYDLKIEKSTLNEFYKLAAKCSNNLGTPFHKMIFFQLIEHYFKDEIRLNKIIYNNKIIGTILEIDYNNTRYDLWAFSMKEYFNFKPNIYMYWESLQNAIASGIKYYDFGRSAINSGTYYFKLGWGAIPYNLDYLIYENGKVIKQEVLQSGGAAKLFSSIWSRLPNEIANYLGPQIRKYIY